MRSIRTYLLTRLLGGALVILSIAGIAVYVVVARSLANRFDENLHDRVLGFASILFQTADSLEFEFSGELMPEYERATEPAFFELRVVGGEVLERSESLADGALTVLGTPSEQPTHWDAPLPDGRDGRYIAQIIEVHHVFPEEGPGRPTASRVLVVIARGRESLIREERVLLAWCAGTCVLLGALIGVVSWRSVERALAPARRLAAALDALDVDRLPARLSVGDVPRELAPVAEKSDALIRRVDAALARERRATADIAHELRTPIAELVTVAEVALRDGRDPENSRRALTTARDVAWRMGRTLSTLLRLARLQAHAESFESSDVELAELVDEALRAADAGSRPATIESAVAGSARLRGDRDALRIVIGNVIGNALHYTPRDGWVRCRVDGEGSVNALIVENGPVDLAPEDLRSLGEPFWRKDGARSDRARTGLGLALSRALCDRSGLALEFSLDGSTFRVRIVPSDAARQGARTAR
ncbi:MAG: hypothetical protein HZA52_09550 [Planctomycetes bacterium]|nr:hypothetical protein [Planctomycetota bacterium]